jgi:hypothetical protein
METADSIDSYILCIDNGGYPASLEVRKVYAVLPDERAAENDYIRVIDETRRGLPLSVKVFRSNPTTTGSRQESACWTRLTQWSTNLVSAP